MKRSHDYDNDDNDDVDEDNQSDNNVVAQRAKMTWSGFVADALGALFGYLTGTEIQRDQQQENPNADNLRSVHIIEKDANGRTALHRSAKEGEAEKTSALLAQNYNPNDPDMNDMIPLHFSAQQGCPEVTRILLKAKSSPDQQDIKKRTPLHLAAGNNHIADVRLLLRADADVSLQDAEGETALHRAANAEHHEIVACYIEEGKNIDIIKNRKGKKAYEPLALMLALVSINAMGALKILVQKGMNIHNIDGENTSLLHLVVKRRPKELSPSTPDIVKGLIDIGADPSLTDKYGRTVLHYVTNPHDARTLLQHRFTLLQAKDNAEAPPLFTAAHHQNLSVCQYLIGRGADPLHVIDSTQSNIIHFARASGNRDFERALEKEIGFDAAFAEKTRAIINALIGQALLMANRQGKKLIILLGESHGEFRGYQVEKMFLEAAKALNINHLMVELPVKSANIVPHEQYLPLEYGKNQLGMVIVGGDNNRGKEIRLNISKEGLLYRNLGTTDTVDGVSQHMLLINGALHLYGLLSHDGTKLDHKKYFMVPVNLAAIIENAFSGSEALHTEVQYAKNPHEVIQFTRDGFDLKQVKTVIENQNNLPNFPLFVEMNAARRAKK